MPVGTGIVVIPPERLPLVIPPVADPVASTFQILPTVTIAGQLLNSPVTDANGIAWAVTELQGWFDSPDMRVKQTVRAGDHGLFVEPAFYGGRQLIVKGFFASTVGTAALMAARDQLLAAVNFSGTTQAQFVVAEQPPKAAAVQRMQGWKLAPTTPVSFTYELHFLAADPRKYDPTPSIITIPSGGSAIITNRGNQESRPLLTFYGPLTGLAVSNGATLQTVSFVPTLNAGDIFTVDMDFRIARLNGNPAANYVYSAPSQWWTLIPGPNQISLLNTGSGYVTVTWRSAWI